MYNSPVMAKYPIYLDLTGVRAVVIGAGSVASRKVKSLLEAGAKVRVVTKTVEKDFEKFCRGFDIEILQTAYSKAHLADAFLVIAATDDETLNTQVYHDCQDLKILCNVVDVPALCNFYVPSVIRRGDLQIAVSTNGKCPAYAAHLRRTFQQLITEDHAAFLDALEEIRKTIISSGIPLEDRKTLLVGLADDESFRSFLDNGPAVWKQAALDMLTARQPQRPNR